MSLRMIGILTDESRVKEKVGRAETGAEVEAVDAIVPKLLDDGDQQSTQVDVCKVRHAQRVKNCRPLPRSVEGTE